MSGTPVLDLLIGIQNRLSEAGIGQVVIGGSTSENVTVLTAYPISDGDDGELLTGVQVRIRVPSRASDIGNGVGELLRRQQIVKDQLGSIDEEQVGSVMVAAAWRKVSTGVQTPDGRPTLADSYYFRHDED